MQKTITFLSLLVAGLLILPAFVNPDHPVATADASKFYSKKVDAIVKSKCYGCHSAEGRSDKAKQALLWDDLPGLAGDQQGEKLKNISKVLEDGTMPPARFLEGNPDKKLTDKETATMKKWADKMAKKASK